MRKQFRQTLSLILSLMMVMSMFAGLDIISFAQDDILSYLTYEINDGEVTITGCDKSISGDVTIPDTIEGYPVTHVGESAFRDCIGLTSVDIPNSVKTIEYGAFMDCHALAIINMPDSITSIKNDAFDYTAYYNDTENWEDGVLYVGEYLIEAESDITNCIIKEGTIVIADNAFNHDCTDMTSVKFPDSVKYIGSHTFSSCSGLTSVKLPDGVKYIGSYAFSYCSGLTSINIPDGVTVIEDSTFNKCTSLTNISIPESVITIGERAFWQCYSLTDIEIPNGVITIDNYAFRECKSLRNINISESVTSIGDNVFLSCTALERINAAENNKYYSNDEYGVLFNKNKTELIQYPIGCSNTDYTIPESVTTIVSEAFANGIHLANINIPDSVTSVGASAFYKTAYYNNEDNWEDGVLYIGKYVITSKNDITSVNIKDGSLVIADGAFNSGGNKLISVTLPDSIIRIGRSAFAYSFNLTSINIPDNVKEIGLWAFAYCSSLTSVTIPEGVTKIDEQTFYQCNSITTVGIPSGITSIENGAFSYCENLENINIPDGVKSIGVLAFYKCNSLTSVTIPNSVTTIGSNAFFDCTNLKEITISNSLTEIGLDAIGRTFDYEVGDYTPVNGAVIYGHADSTAETYAKENGITFNAIETEEPPVEEPPVEEPPVEEPPVEEPPVEEPPVDEPPVEEPPVEEPADDGKLNVKGEGGIATDFENKISQIGTEETAETLSEMINNENFAIVDKNGTALTEKDLVGTGSKIQILDKDGNIINEYTIFVPTDIDGNGKTTAADARLALRASAKLENIEGVYAMAADVTDDSKITASDARKILRKSAGLEK